MGPTLAEASQRWQARTRLGQGHEWYDFESWLERYFRWNKSYVIEGMLSFVEARQGSCFEKGG